MTALRKRTYAVLLSPGKIAGIAVYIFKETISEVTKFKYCKPFIYFFFFDTVQEFSHRPSYIYNIMFVRVTGRQDLQRIPERFCMITGRVGETVSNSSQLITSGITSVTDLFHCFQFDYWKNLF